MFDAIARIILRNRSALLIGVIAVTALMAWRASHVKLSYEAAKILPESDSTWAAYKEFKKTFGEDGSVMVIGFESKEIFKVKTFGDWYELSQSIKETEGIQEVVSVGRSFHVVKNEEEHKLTFKPLITRRPTSQAVVDSLKEALANMPFYRGLLFNDSMTVTLMAITLDQAKLNTRGRIETVNHVKELADEFAAANNVTLHYSGLPYIRTAVSGKILSEMKVFMALAVLVTALILLFFFRSFYAVIFPMLVVVAGVVWSFGTLDLFGYKITILTSLIAPLIIVIGIPNCILLLNKYQQEYARHGNKMKSLARTISRIGLSTFFANATTSIGFLVFYFTRSEVLMEFGLIAGLNVLLTYVISLIVIPIVFSYLPPPSSKQISHLDRRALNKILDKIDNWVHFYRLRIYVFVAIVVAVSIWGMTRITTVGFVVDDLPKKDVIYKDLKFFERHFRGVLPFEIAVDTKKAGGALELKTLYKINRLQKLLAAYPEFSEPVSVVEGVKFSYQGLNDNDPKYYIVPNVEELARLSGYASEAKGNERLYKSILDSSRKITRISFQVADVGSIRIKKLLEEIRPRVDTIFPATEYNVRFTGNSIVFLKNNDYLLLNLKESILLAIFFIGTLMFFLFLSFRMVIIALIPSMTPLLLTAAMMGFFGIALKPSTILIFSIAFGISSDGTMYFLTKYRQELRKFGGSISKTVSIAIQETGVSMIYSAVILFFGFFIFVVSSFGGTSALGTLISVTLLIAMFSNLIFLPSLLLSLERIVIGRAFLKEPLIQIYDEEEDVDLDELEVRKAEVNEKY